MCAAVLQLHKPALMASGSSFDDLLSYCVLLSGNMDLAKSMRRAENLFKAAGEQGIKHLQPLDSLA